MLLICKSLRIKDLLNELNVTYIILQSNVDADVDFENNEILLNGSIFNVNVGIK